LLETVSKPVLHGVAGKAGMQTCLESKLNNRNVVPEDGHLEKINAGNGLCRGFRGGK
jgi:hypothetical protein